MADFFEKQGDKGNGSERTMNEVTNDVALERFQKFRPPTFNGETGDEAAEKWVNAIGKIFRTLNYSDERKVSFAEF